LLDSVVQGCYGLKCDTGPLRRSSRFEGCAAIYSAAIDGPRIRHNVGGVLDNYINVHKSDAPVRPIVNGELLTDDSA